MNFNLIRPFLSLEIGTTYEIGRPFLFFVMIPAFILAIIPFFRLHKSRRYNIKHIVPLFIHLIILAIATALITDIKITETTTAPEETQVIVVADMSDSNTAMKDQMNNYIKELIENADEKTEIGVVVFANESTYFSEFGKIKDDYLDVKASTIKTENTNIQAALEYTKTLFAQTGVNKRVLLMSDGRQTVGNAWSAAKKLSLENIRLDGVHFDVATSEDTPEVQLLSLNSKVNDKAYDNVTISIAVKATKATTGKITFYEMPQIKVDDDDEDNSEEEDVKVHEQEITLKKGNNSFPVNYTVTEPGIHAVYAVIEVEDDTVEQNNTLYSWFSIDGKANILLVDGDGTQVSSKITSLIDTKKYTYETTKTKDFPTSMEELLAYDEVVLMNVNFADFPAGSSDLIKRYVEEVGRGIVFTCGSNTYNYNDQTYADNPIIDILPVDLKIDERKEVIATVITVDMSGSMGVAVDGVQKNQYGQTLTRYDMVLESVIALINPKPDANGVVNANFADEDYIGIVLFESDATIALPLTQLYEKEWIEKQVRYAFESHYYVHTDESNPTYRNRVYDASQAGKNGFDVNGYKVRGSGTMYSLGINAANKMLAESGADLKQMVFLSDGEPTDKTADYKGTIDRMANSGVVTSTLGIGNDSAAALNELALMATIGHGRFTPVNKTLDLTGSLVQIAESIKGKPINEKITKLEKRNDGKVLVGVGDKFDKIQGYYGTTIKNGAKIILSADDLRPIIAEWKTGLGHATVYMSDLGGKWSNSLFTDKDEVDNLRLVENLLVNSLNDDVGSSGLKVTSERTEDTTKITVETEARIRDEEELVAFVTDSDGNMIEYSGFTRVADTKYRKEVMTPNQTGTYHVEVKLLSSESELCDRAEYAVVGFYEKGYDLFSTSGESVIEDLSAAGEGKVMKDPEAFFEISKEELVQYDHNISTPVLIVLLLLFILDLLIRNFSPKKKDKKKMMTDEEQYESMRGR